MIATKSVSGPSSFLQTLSTQEPDRAPAEADLELREKFQEFVAGTFYKQMLKSMRSSQRKPAYFHGGQGEDVFQSQMDEIVTDNFAKNHGDTFAGNLYDIYQKQRGGVIDAAV
ncbi:MAG TPA: rod-binding protein [Candidatus Saccharimonadales bacterium]|nr:rod-binding protein [Candidatus Saccharimonadales bacterium]